jgi:hypothetical protein
VPFNQNLKSAARILSKTYLYYNLDSMICVLLVLSNSMSLCFQYTWAKRTPQKKRGGNHLIRKGYQFLLY